MSKRAAAAKPDPVVVHGITAGIVELAQPIDSLVPFPGNARKHATGTLVESLRVNGQYRPIVVQASTRFVLAGNGTLLAVRELGWTHVAATVVDVDEQAARRIVAVDIRASDLAWYDQAALADLLSGIDGLAGTGFTQQDLDELLAVTLPRPSLTDPDEAPGVPVKPVSRPGDVWQLGPHRLLVGDCTDVAAVEGMLAGDRCEAMWTDPPYGVEYKGKAGSIKNDRVGDLETLLPGFLAVATVVMLPGAPFYIAHPAGPKSLPFYDAIRDAGWLFRQQLVWVKSSLVLGQTDYHYRHEPILAGVVPGVDDGDLDEEQHGSLLYGFTPGGEGRLGRGGTRWYGDNRATTVFEVPKPPRNADHPTMKPVALITAMLTNSVRPGGLVYEPFGGSGSTLIACHLLGMTARVVELDPKYADVIVRRYQAHTGVVPVRDGVEVDMAGAVAA